MKASAEINVTAYGDKTRVTITWRDRTRDRTREFIIGRLAIEVPTKTWKRACADFIAGKSGNYSCKPATKGPS